jgi:hypothetical protein
LLFLPQCHPPVILSWRIEVVQLARLARVANGAAQREVRRLVEGGILERRARGNSIYYYYQCNRNSPVFQELQGLVLKTSGVADVLRAALVPLADRAHKQPGRDRRPARRR